MKHNINNLPSFKGLKQRVVWLANEFKTFATWTGTQINSILNLITGINSDINDLEQDVTAIQNIFAAEPKVYKALLTQTGTDAPTAVVLENTLGVVPTFAYTNSGEYTMTAVGMFIANKFAILQNVDYGRIFSYEELPSNDNILLTSAVDVFSKSDNLLSRSPLFIEVYP